MDGITYIIQRNDGAFLMQHRTANAPIAPNQWCFPGGAKEFYETFLRAVIREIREETGIKVLPKDCREIFSYKYNKSDFDVVYLIKKNPKKIIPTEGTMGWMNLELIQHFELPSDQHLIVTKLLEIK